MSSNARIGCPLCFGELSIALPAQLDREMICRCLKCHSLVIIDDIVIVTQANTAKPQAKPAFLATPPSFPIILRTHLPRPNYPALMASR